MKLKIKDRRMKQKVMVVSTVENDNLWEEDEIWIVKIEPIYGGIFGDI